MPKNPYLIENKKPFETVQEIDNKYEVPSFEEFMRNYENDGNVNYDDLKGGDIGTQKGYGPGLLDRDRVEDRIHEKYERIHKWREEEREKKQRRGLCLKDGCLLSGK